MTFDTKTYGTIEKTQDAAWAKIKALVDVPEGVCAVLHNQRASSLGVEYSYFSFRVYIPKEG